jgi:hypothetical protein
MATGKRTPRVRKAAVDTDSENEAAVARREARQRAKRDARAAEGNTHEEESDETVKGGFYINPAGQPINARGEVVDEKTYKPLKGEDLEDFEEQRRAELDEMSDDESRVATIDDEDEQ